MDYTDIQKKLREGRLSDTFPSLRKKAAEMGFWELTEEVEGLWTTYQQMLRFMLQGMDDEQSGGIRRDICGRLGVAASRLERMERIKTRPSEKYATTRKALGSIPSFESIVSHLETLSQEMNHVGNDELLRDSVRQHRMEELWGQHEGALRNLFDWVWTSEVWQNADKHQASRLIFSDSIRRNAKAVFVSAVTLSLLEQVDEAKLLFLLDCYLVDDALISQRALVGFLLVYHLRYDEVKQSGDLKDQLAIYRDDAAFVRDLYGAMMQLQMSCTTDSVTSKMRNDIMPVLTRSLTRQKPEKQNLDPEAFVKNGENPEWMDDENTNKKMMEMAEMQMDGADVYYASFSMMKGYSFFGHLPHWFYPFSLDENPLPELKKFASGSISKLIRLILGGSPFCDSDKYSLCFMFSNFGGVAENAIEEQVSRQLPKGMDIDELAENADLQKPKRTDFRRQYVFDLYRFFYNYPYRQQFANPFEQLKKQPVTPFSNKGLKRLLAGDEERLAQYADFLMRKEFYQAALDLFATLARNEFEPLLASVWQKLGFCHQKLGHVAETIHAYTVANSIKPNSKWTLSHLASLCYASGQMEDAVRYYRELLDMNPENQKYLVNAAQALMLCQRHEEALPLLHKASFLNEDAQPTKALLAWCLILNGQKDKAMKLVLDMLAADAGDGEANVLFAVVALTDGKPQEAYQRLRPLVQEDNRMGDVRQKLDALCRCGLLDANTLTLFMDALTLQID